MACATLDAVRRCPFLHKVSCSEGEAYALRLAADPFRSAAARGPAAPVFPEDSASSFESTLQLFHGPGGVVPLTRFAATQPAAGAAAKGCPFRALRAAAAPEQQLGCARPQTAADPAAPRMGRSGAAVVAAAPAGGASLRPRSAAAPFASMSLSGFGFLPDPGELFRQHQKRRKRKQQQRGKQPGRGPPDAPASAAGPGGAGGGSSSSSSKGRSGGARPPRAAAHQASSSGNCPMRAYLGPLGGLIPLTAAGRLTCPPIIVTMRAAVAALPAVRDLRPRALPIRALAMGATAVAANVPCGMVREHTRKFSLEWVLAVHATIPFVAMLRKAVLMPPWAILLTVAGSIAGQTVGARMERARLAAPASSDGAHASERALQWGRLAGGGSSSRAPGSEGPAPTGTCCGLADAAPLGNSERALPHRQLVG